MDNLYIFLNNGYHINNFMFGGLLFMKLKYVFIIIVLVIAIGGVSYYFYFKENNLNNNISNDKNITENYNTSKVSSVENTLQENISIENQEAQNNSDASASNNNQNTSTSYNNQNTSTSEDRENVNTSPSEKKETEIASFSTKIYTKDSERQNNVSITCNSLNDTIVENGKTFSFCNTVGKATSSKGYQKADVFKNGEKIKALGGGNCQVSSTLYNAVLKISNLKVTERHAHSNDVPYVKKGKDAAVSYGTYDFKFVNNTRT